MTHMKRLPAPKHYPIARKEGQYTTTIKGSRSPEKAIPAVLFLREVTEYAETKKEAKQIIRDGNLLRNGEPVRDIQDGIGVLDVVELPPAEETYRVIMDGRKLSFVPVTDGDRVAARIQGKQQEGNSFVYRLHNGENYESETEYSTGNTLIFSDGSVKEVELEEGAQVLVIEGAHAGDVAEVNEIRERGMNPNTALVEPEDQEFETRLENLVAFDTLQVEGDQ
jgi:small subunit ribosomal protein S4e